MRKTIILIVLIVLICLFFIISNRPKISHHKDSDSSEAVPTPAPTPIPKSFDEMDDWSSDMDVSEIKDYTPPRYYVSEAERYCYTSNCIVVCNKNDSCADIKSGPDINTSTKYICYNERTLDYLGESIKDKYCIWYHVGYYTWNSDTASYNDGWISSDMCDVYI